MTISASALPALPRAVGALACLVFGLALSGCANMSDGMTAAFADPAKYDLYDCKQLETERKSLATREAELQGLMAKAETGVGGALVSELAYRNDYVAVRGQEHFAEQAWRRNKCRESTPASATTAIPTPPVVRPAPRSKSGRAIY
jgi:hypothetical protein